MTAGKHQGPFKDKMPYQQVKYQHISHHHLKEVFARADLLLKDVYGMFKLPPKLKGAGSGDWAIALVLVCIIDGIARHVYPTDRVKDQEQRFKCLIREKLHWGNPKNKKWYALDQSANVIYREIRNALVHEVALDKPDKARPIQFSETAVGKWGLIPTQLRSIVKIDRMLEWNDGWPILGVQNHNNGKRLKLCCAALYWAVKHMINTLAEDPRTIEEAARHYQDSAAKGLLDA